MKSPINKNRLIPNHGFTLIEIMVVLAILGLLASVALPRFAGRTHEARQQTARLQIENIGMALDSFEFDCGRYPTTTESMEALRLAPPGLTGWKGPYLKKLIPKDPWGEDYRYLSPGQRNPDYELYSIGPDKLEGSDDDIGNWD
jgi:general secretion pathway protein G